MNKEKLNKIMCQADDRLDAMKDKLVFQSQEIERLKEENKQLKKELDALYMSEEQWLDETLGGDKNE